MGQDAIDYYYEDGKIIRHQWANGGETRKTVTKVPQSIKGYSDIIADDPCLSEIQRQIKEGKGSTLNLDAQNITQNVNYCEATLETITSLTEAAEQNALAITVNAETIATIAGLLKPTKITMMDIS